LLYRKGPPVDILGEALHWVAILLFPIHPDRPLGFDGIVYGCWKAKATLSTLASRELASIYNAWTQALQSYIWLGKSARQKG
jgi:hypothetical protein